MTRRAKIVHILKEGVSLCRMPGLPIDWPEGHAWLSFQDKEGLDRFASLLCDECVRIHREAK